MTLLSKSILLKYNGNDNIKAIRMPLKASDSGDLYSEVMMYEHERAEVIKEKPALKLPAETVIVSQ